MLIGMTVSKFFECGLAYSEKEKVMEKNKLPKMFSIRKKLESKEKLLIEDFSRMKKSGAKEKLLTEEKEDSNDISAIKRLIRLEKSSTLIL